MTAPTIRRIDDSTPFHSSSSWIGAGLAFAAASGVAFWLGFPLVVDPNDAAFNPAILLVAFLAIVGVVQTVRAIRGGNSARRFGTSAFEMEGGQVGSDGLLRGRVLTSRDLSPAAGFRVRLRCIESVRIADAAGSSQGRNEDRVSFEAESMIAGIASSARDGIPVQFQLPRQPIRTSTSSRGVRWTLEVGADVEGARYEALFGVPVASRGM